jgi:deferrochelatase/peroxidase EfeB
VEHRPATDAQIATLQGNILRGYRLPLVRHLLLEVTDRAAARGFLAAAVAGTDPDVPKITTEQKIAPTTPKLETTFNLGFTFAGLGALGLGRQDLDSFPTEFKEGMTRRAAKLGDFGASAPAHWPAPYHVPDRLHIVATAYARDVDWLDRLRDRLGKSFRVLGQHDGRSLPNGEVFFGYQDGLSQPKYIGFHEGTYHPDDAGRRVEPEDPLGTMLLGQPTRLPGLYFGIPTPSALGNLGTFNAFRVLKQDVFGFDQFLTDTVLTLEAKGLAHHLVGTEDVADHYPYFSHLDRLREVVAAQLCGRWRNGVALELRGPQGYDADGKPNNEFDYGPDARCPVGAHIRRNNPRGGEIVQRIANFTRRLARRGMSYGPAFHPERPDGEERGLLGNFLCASLGAQFEAVMCDWLNLGLNSPDITGSNDPLLGANIPETSWFDLNLWSDGPGSAIRQHRIHGLPRFVTTRGGAYTFLPTVTGIQYLAGLKG